MSDRRSRPLVASRDWHKKRRPLRAPIAIGEFRSPQDKIKINRVLTIFMQLVPFSFAASLLKSISIPWGMIQLDPASPSPSSSIKYEIQYEYNQCKILLNPAYLKKFFSWNFVKFLSDDKRSVFYSFIRNRDVTAYRFLEILCTLSCIRRRRAQCAVR